MSVANILSLVLSQVLTFAWKKLKNKDLFVFIGWRFWGWVLITI